MKKCRQCKGRLPAGRKRFCCNSCKGVWYSRKNHRGKFSNPTPCHCLDDVEDSMHPHDPYSLGQE